MKSILRSMIAICFFLSQSALSVEQPSYQTIQINGYPLEYLESGEGRPLLFVHGAISDLRLWNPYVEMMPENRKFVAYTQRYHGTNDWPDDALNYSRTQHVEDLIDFIQAMDLQPVDVVSYSYSGGVVLQAMLQRPELFNSGIHYEPAMVDHLINEPGFEQAVKKFRSGFGPMANALKAEKYDESALRFAEAVFGLEQGGIKNLSPEAQNIFADNGRTVPPFLQLGEWPAYDCEELSSIQTPNLIIQGGETHVYFSMTAESLSECLSNSLLLTMDGSGHGGPGMEIEQFGELVVSFTALMGK